MQEEYGSYTWPSSTVLAHYVWLHRRDFVGKHFLELGAGTGLPGILAAKLGAASVTLTDRPDHPHILDNLRSACALNNVNCEVLGLSWGVSYSQQCLPVKELDIVLGADVLYDTCEFEGLLATARGLLESFPRASFITAYQHRSGHRSLEFLLAKWGFRCLNVTLAEDILPPEKSVNEIVEVVDLILR
eukprot:jgi/Mesen1/4086/ME000214S03268